MHYLMKATKPLFIAAFLSLTACATEPSVISSEDVKTIPEGYEVVSICYKGEVGDRSKAEKLALAECPIGTENLHLWDHDVVMNGCPILKRKRVTFLCAK